MKYLFLSIFLLFVFFAPITHAQQAVFLIRHAEQALDVEDPPLTEDGLQRAKNWASILRDTGINAIYTSKKVRTRQTGGVIAQELKIPLEKMPRRDVTGLVNRVRERHPDDNVLIVSHSQIIPKLLKAFGSKLNTMIKPKDYDNLFVIMPNGDGDVTVLRFRH